MEWYHQYFKKIVKACEANVHNYGNTELIHLFPDTPITYQKHNEHLTVKFLCLKSRSRYIVA